MSKEEKKIYAICYPLGVLFAAFIVYTTISDGKASKTAFAEELVYFTEDETKTEIRPVLEPQSGMPCENPEQYERWLKEYEQKTGKEKVYYPKRIHKPLLLEEPESESKYDAEVLPEESSTEVETESVEYTEASEVPNTEIQPQGIRKYKIVGAWIDEDIQERLYMALDAARIAYWYEVAVCQLFQESRGERWAVSNDGRDHGIFQYRLQYWDAVSAQYGFAGASIYDIDAQIGVYCRQMTDRLNRGLSIDEAISRHKTSDEVTWVDAEYVAQVKQWLNKLEVK